MKKVVLSIVLVFAAVSLFPSDVAVGLNGKDKNWNYSSGISNVLSFGFYGLVELRDLFFHGGYARLMFSADAYCAVWNTNPEDFFWFIDDWWIFESKLLIGYELGFLIPAIGVDASVEIIFAAPPTINWTFTLPLTLGIVVVDSGRLRIIFWPEVDLKSLFIGGSSGINLDFSYMLSADFILRLQNWGIHIAPSIEWPVFDGDNRIGVEIGASYKF